MFSICAHVRDLKEVYPCCRPDELPGKQLLRQPPAALDSVEVSKVCPVCGLAFPQSSITDHVNLCSSSSRKVCPVCSMSFPSTTPDSLFSMHVNEHFEDSGLVWINPENIRIIHNSERCGLSYLKYKKIPSFSSDRLSIFVPSCFFCASVY